MRANILVVTVFLASLWAPVALAGGFTYRAKEDGIEIQRGGSGAPSVVVTVDTPILPGDILRVPERFF